MQNKHKKSKIGSILSFLKTFFETFFYLTVSFGLVLVLCCCVLLWWLNNSLPTIQEFNTKVRTPSVIVQALDGTIIARYGDLYDDFIHANELPKHTINAFLSVEDKRFFNHNGIDYIGIVRAAIINYRAGKVVQGGSTLTQQLAKNILTSNGLFDVKDRSIKRKLQEFLLAVKLESYFSKEEIITLYLNRIYFGSGTYGVDAASRRYFNKSAKNLNIFESAILAGLLKAPSRYSPRASPQKAISRAKIVLKKMYENDLIDEGQTEEDLIKFEKTFLSQLCNEENGYMYFADWVYETIPSIIGPIEEDITVMTTLNTDMQKIAEKICLEFYQKCSEEYKYTQTSLVAMTPEGEVLAMIGGMDYGKSQFNRATSAHRQPGSAFKTFVYLAALEEGVEAETLIDDSPYEQGSWKPGNYKWKELGEISVFEAFVYSVNSVCIRVAKLAGIKNVIKTARRLGIVSELNRNLTLALGSSEMTLLELVGAYAPFANKGNATWSYCIMEIRNKNGDILYSKPNEIKRRVIEPEHLETMRKMMRAVVKRGTGRAANVDEKMFGKTGSNSNKDAWVILCREPVEPCDCETNENGKVLFEDMTTREFIDEKGLVLGIWIGNDSEENKMANNSTGGRVPTRMAGALLKKLLQKEEKKTTLDILEEKVAEKIQTDATTNDVIKIKTLNDFFKTNATDEEEIKEDKEFDGSEMVEIN